jgi:hypothetical protein
MQVKGRLRIKLLMAGPDRTEERHVSVSECAKEVKDTKVLMEKI